MDHNYFKLHSELEQKFIGAGIDELADIDWIICEVTGKKRNSIKNLQHFSNTELSQIFEAAEKRINHIPLGYIFGHTEFFGRKFKVNSDVLIPRLDTEVLVEQLIAEIKDKNQFYSVLDIGTGSGAVAITLALETGADVTAVDISENALKVASENASELGADVKFIKSDIFDGVGDRKFDIIASNPPYIETDVIPTLDSEVKDYEPHLALDGGKDGLNFYKKIISGAKRHLNSDGKIFFEIGYNQAEALKSLLQKDFKDIKVIKDYGGNDRVVIASLKN